MRYVLVLFALLSACSSSPKKTDVVAETCGADSPVIAQDMEAFGFLPAKGKVIVMRVFATWCPYCKDDLARLGEKFKSGEWSPDDVQIYLMAYKNKSENQKTYLNFIKSEFAQFNIPIAAAQIIFVDKDYAELSTAKNFSGKPLFEGWKGLPFGLIFGKDGRLVSRGHFTQGPDAQDAHYALISRLSKEVCPAHR